MNSNHSAIAIIPARGGSKRINDKNIRLFCGKPIIAYSIEAARQSNLFDNITVSTDSDQIAAIAKELGAEAPFLRPVELADDFTGTDAVVKHAIEWYKERGRHYEFVCCIYATAPFIQVRYLKQGFEMLRNSPKSFAFAVTSFSFPIRRAIRVNQNGEVEALWPEFIDSRSQDLEEAYHDAGQFYWGRSEAFQNNITVFSQESIPVVLPRYLVQDIDTMEDWHMAELKYRALTIYNEQKRYNGLSKE